MITRSYINLRRQSFCRLIVVVIWLIGLLFGITAAQSAIEVLPHLMRRLYVQPVSIVGLLVRATFSFLITVISLILGKPWLQLPAALLEAFCLAFWVEATVLVWHSTTAWIICLLFASSFLSASYLLWFWFRHIPEFQPCPWCDLLLCAILHEITILTEFYLYDCCIL